MTYHKALLIPINSERQIFIQDRRGFKAPDWGFFGGSIEAGESPIEAVIRETKEELVITLEPQELVYLGNFYTEYEDEQIWRDFYVYKTDRSNFDVQEGKGGKWVTAVEAKAVLLQAEHFDTLWDAIQKVIL